MGLRCRSRGVYGGSYPVSTWRAIWKLFRLCETRRGPRDPPSGRGPGGCAPSYHLCAAQSVRLSPSGRGPGGCAPSYHLCAAQSVRLSPSGRGPGGCAPSYHLCAAQSVRLSPSGRGLGAVPPVTIFVRLNPCDYLPLAGGLGAVPPVTKGRAGGDQRRLLYRGYANRKAITKSERLLRPSPTTQT